MIFKVINFKQRCWNTRQIRHTFTLAITKCRLLPFFMNALISNMHRVTVTHSRIENSMKLPSQNVLAVLLLQTCMVLLLRSQKVICRREKERVILDRKSGSLYRFRQQYILLVSNINPSSFVNVTLCNILIRASDLLRQYMRCSDITEPPRWRYM